MTGRSRAVVVAMMLWWAVFGCISAQDTLNNFLSSTILARTVFRRLVAFWILSIGL